MIIPASGQASPMEVIFNAMNQPGAVRHDLPMGMTMNEYQSLAGRTINPVLNDLQIREHALHLMVAEVGELHGLYQKTYQGHAFDEQHAMKEVGDIMWAIAEYCTAMGWTMEDVARMNIDKLKARFPDGFSEERSLHRAEGDV